MLTLMRATGLALLVLIVSACGANFDINVEDGDIVIDSSFRVTEQLLNNGETSALSFNEVDLLRNAEYDIQEGQVVISGDMLCEDNTRRDGSITVEMGVADDGFINVEITDVQSECDVSSSLIEQAQTELADGLAEAARELEDSDATVTFNEVTLGDDTLNISLQVRASMNNEN